MGIKIELPIYKKIEIAGFLAIIYRIDFKLARMSQTI